MDSRDCFVASAPRNDGSTLFLPSITPSVAENALPARALSLLPRGFENQKCNKGKEVHDQLQEDSPEQAVNRAFIPCGTGSSRTTILSFYNRHFRDNPLQVLSLRAWP